MPQRFAEASEQADLSALAALPREDARQAMPPAGQVDAGTRRATRARPALARMPPDATGCRVGDAAARTGNAPVPVSIT